MTMTTILSAPSADPKPLPPFRSAISILRRSASRLAPPARISVSEAAAKYRFVKNPGGGTSGQWDNLTTPYLVEPMDNTISREFAGVIMAAPAQCGKTDGLLINSVVYATVVDPADMLIVQTTDLTARDFSKRRLKRLNRDSPAVGKAQLAGDSADNVLEKQYRGMTLSIGYPSATQLAGRPIARILMTDYDRMPDDIEGEGSAFSMAEKRNQTYGSRGTIVAESSPSRPLLSAKWKPATPHEAPPTSGIFALYNRGDRRRWKWPCPHCGEFFEGSFSLLTWDDGLDPIEAGATAAMVCPENGCIIEPRFRNQMNRAGKWVPEGCTIDVAGVISGTPRTAPYASYWLKGPAAAFSTWAQLVTRYLEAKEEFVKTGKEESLKTTINVDQCEAYIPEAARHNSSLEADTLIERAENYGFKKVPAAARFLTAAVDVQANRFEVMVRAWGQDLESWIIDYFKIFKTTGNDGEDRPVDPAVNSEDWDLLINQVFALTYPLADGSGEMGILRTGIDSGGAAGVTANAYSFYRRRKRARQAGRMILTKGASYMTAPRVAKNYPDTKRKDRKAEARGEIPVWFFNVNMLKDEADSMMRILDPGPRALHLPVALLSEQPPHQFFEMLTAEERDPSGKWRKIRPRNEAFDLVVMSHVVALSVKADRIKWDSPPSWAAPWSSNSFVTGTPASDQDPDEGPPPQDKPAAGITGRRRRGRPRRGGLFANTLRRR